ncbi:malonyl-CoA synthase [Mesorhizobium sp. M1C.F.Ca.ET.193.01.1.1]|uniref:malonate--CoA ligase n=3 Tax=Mesorhizobium TaxID=68287 RepID=UPI000FD5B719|nr:MULTISPECIES: malonyl-CoA synthase [unclassified Mesorhizobium]TGT02236.1 malonyl-CoA synthase [bacterium M00.F.Ca.ET.177.01.1.1]TGQ54489.1 malonyl-CoA synthase [Mesorhizobium sp. M1C.F.Ca.ET.210.01.1.1]TGQ72485.1 malonyl-CoA synthase [Mesorhizobium sp. M1C.F.Ca.ET.212.01.1.1]TGR10281.1 malonyl-CoA synthase [Mesorhizobium sp. M1C.F.Ca.ET.204.01.1.1]TGR30884.1 malonyl-CoA synthase [Mesorhizobium sp. M1C.F.Ca.ET.196.01.1.1]
MTSYLYERLTQTAPSDDKIVIETPNGRILTYGDLRKESARFANLLVSLGVAPGDRVAVQIEKSPDAILVYLACLRTGAIFLPLNPAYTTVETEYYLGDGRPTVFICDPAAFERILPVTASINVAHVETLGNDEDGSFARKAKCHSVDFDDVQRGPDDLAAILYTSGTTGRSKGAMLSHGNLASNAATLKDFWRLTSDDILIHALPVYHTHGLFVAVNTMLMAGGSMHFLPGFNAELILSLMSRSTVLMGVPTFYTRLLQNAALTPTATSNMRMFISGSAPLWAETHQEWQARTGHQILERYGMTETNMNTSNPCEGDRIAGTVGIPLPGISVRVVDPETGVALPPGEVGMLEVKGPNVFAGYWQMPEKTASEFSLDGFFMTGDLGRINERGYIHIVGRAKDLVITGGFNVYPIEIESEIDALPGVAESAVIGVPHADFGEGVTAIVVPKKGASIDEARVLSALQGRLAKFKLPKRVLFTDELPRNAMGKVQKAMLRQTYADLYKA